MATVRIDTGNITADTPIRNVPEKDWPKLVMLWCDFIQVRMPYDCRKLIEYVNTAEEYGLPQKLGFPSLEEFIKAKLELDPQSVEWAKHGLELLDPSSPQPFDKCVDIGRKVAEVRSDAPIRDRGRPPEIERINCDNNTINSRGDTQDYLLRRLARDKPELLDLVETGELSPRAAALKAGIRKPILQITVHQDPRKTAEAIIKKLSPDVLEVLAELLTKSETNCG